MLFEGGTSDHTEKKYRKYLKNWPSYQFSFLQKQLFLKILRNFFLNLNCYSSVNSEDVKVWFLANIFVFIVEKDSIIKSGGHRQSWVAIFCEVPNWGKPSKKFNFFLTNL